MATGALDANGVWQYGEDDPLSPFSTFMNLGEASVSAKIAAMLGAVGTVVAAKSTSDQTGATGADVVCTTCQVALTAGTWQVQGGASLINTAMADWTAAALYNQTTLADVADSIGSAGVTSTTQGLAFVTRPVVLTVTTTTNIRVKGLRAAGGSGVKFNASFTPAGTPSAWITAVRLK